MKRTARRQRQYGQDTRQHDERQPYRHATQSHRNSPRGGRNRNRARHGGSGRGWRYHSWLRHSHLAFLTPLPWITVAPGPYPQPVFTRRQRRRLPIGSRGPPPLDIAITNLYFILSGTWHGPPSRSYTPLQQLDCQQVRRRQWDSFNLRRHRSQPDLQERDVVTGGDFTSAGNQVL